MSADKAKNIASEEIENVLDNPIEEDDIPFELDDDGEKINVEQEEILEELSLRQERFCQLYALDTRFMGSWVNAYLEVYDIDTTKKWWYWTACASASRLLTNVKIYTRINNLLEEQWLNDQFVDKQLLYVISQQSDMWNKVQAIKEYNKLKQRITDRMEVQVKDYTFQSNLEE